LQTAPARLLHLHLHLLLHLLLLLLSRAQHALSARLTKTCPGSSLARRARSPTPAKTP
jgi:hypothetical protein